VKHRYPECELYGIDYGHDFPWDVVERGETVFMVDFSLQPYPQMLELENLVNLIWIDHHKSAIEEYMKSPVRSAVLDVCKGACELTWEFLFKSGPPESVHLLGRYDVWDHSNPKTLPFQYGMRLRAKSPQEDMSFWKNVFHTFPDNILRDGGIVLEYIKQDNSKYAGACAFETTLHSLHCIAINKQLTNSQLFDAVWDEKKYDAMLSFGWRNGQWTVSLYSTKDDVDVSVVAKDRGDGGHKGAAGFQCKTLPFELR